MKKLLLTITFAALTIVSVLGQSRALTFQEAEKQGIPFQKLDSLYKSAIHSDATLAVFKTPDQQTELQHAYVKLLQDLGTYLRDNNFKWETQVRGANRIYMQPDGRIDYFLFHFPEGQLTPEKEQQFTQLLNRFIRNYRFAITAPEKFAQCSAVRYSDN
ncbi:hypothetical protein [Pontibacter burrus]|uniref:Uncharacterized protein n=1 Tax=Pontibacter burrus TaxID=2704466 RepID=A0A6B3LYR1_9BACT|nr:hypothetical protein [Pontibacter burrus]NEM98577.1 hypothetical protein [Pontibacter burrus]